MRCQPCRPHRAVPGMARGDFRPGWLVDRTPVTAAGPGRGESYRTRSRHGRSQLGVWHALDRPLGHDEEMAPTQTPERNAQLFPVDGTTGHPWISFGAGGWKGPWPGHARQPAQTGRSSGQMTKTRDINAAWNSAKRQIAREHPDRFVSTARSSVGIGTRGNDPGRSSRPPVIASSPPWPQEKR